MAANLFPEGPAEWRAVADRAGMLLLRTGRAPVVGSPGLSQSTLNRLLNGVPVKRTTLLAFAETMGVRYDWLVSGEGDVRSAGAPDQPAEAATIPFRQREFSFEGVDLARLGAAVRVAQRIHRPGKEPMSADEEAGFWLDHAQAVIDVYAELDRLTAEASKSGPGGLSEASESR